MKVQFSVIGEPRGKQRPRFQRIGNKVRTYTPDQTVDYESLVKWTYGQKYPNTVLEGPIIATIKAYFPIPKSISKRKREKMLLDDVYYPKKPDADNVAKIVLDALNKIAYNDDGQICMMQVEKFYSPYPRVDVWLQELEDGNKD